MGLELCGRSIHQAVNPLFSTTDALQRGAEIRVNSKNDEQCNRKDVANQLFSTLSSNES